VIQRNPLLLSTTNAQTDRQTERRRWGANRKRNRPL